MRHTLSAFPSLIIIIGLLFGINSIANAQGDIIPTACDNATYTLNPGTTIHFYDDGGPGGDCASGGNVADGNFANANCETITTICPAPGETLNIQFIVLSMFATPSGFDWMVIYEGSTTSGNILFDNSSGGPDNPYGTSCNFDNTTTFCATDECLTFEFHASGVVNREGWDAIVTSSPSTNTLDIAVTAATCATDGSAEILNYDNTVTYTFTPAGPSVGGSGEITGAIFGQNYSVEVGNGGCAAAATFQVEAQLDTPDAPDVDITAPTCLADGSAEITNYDNTATYTFSPAGPSVGGSGEITGATFGQNYSVEIDNGSCTAAATFQVEEQLDAPDTPAVDVIAPTCLADGSAEVTNYDNTVTYTFTPVGPSVGGSGEITGAAFGQNYSVEIDNGSCTATATFQIEEQLEIPTIDAGSDQEVCAGTTVNLAANNPDGANISWDNGVMDGVGFTPSVGTTTYTVVGTSIQGCSDTDDLTVTVKPQPTVSFDADVKKGCSPLTVQFNSTSSSSLQCTYSLEDGTQLTGCNTSYIFVDPGCYDVTLTVDNNVGCSNNLVIADFICVDSPPIASFSANPGEIDNISGEVNFNNTSVGADSYSWDFGDGSNSTAVNPTHEFDNGEAYDEYVVELVAFSDLGCPDTVKTVLSVTEELIYYVPNSFTPNGNEFNETFKPIFTSGFDPLDYNIRIYNRWGEVVFESNNAAYGWDGTYGTKSSQAVQEGVYVWEINFKKSKNDERVEAVGHVTLLR
jgi:gliding motility-associated-like protein